MVIYEVNLTINSEIYEKFLVWLKKHVEEILTFPGFIDGEIFHVDHDDPDRQYLMIAYTLAGEDDLTHYFEFHSEAMRREGKLRFGDRFEASRRILTSLA